MFGTQLYVQRTTLLDILFIEDLVIFVVGGGGGWKCFDNKEKNSFPIFVATFALKGELKLITFCFLLVVIAMVWGGLQGFVHDGMLEATSL